MITAAIITLSDKGSKGERKDGSGPAIAEIIKRIDADVLHYDILPDEQSLIKEKLLCYCGKVDIIFTTGGTGLSPRDVTPDATLEVIEKQIPGIEETMRMEGLSKTRRSMLSRAVAGYRGSTLIINLPGSPAAVKENLEVILDVLPHAVAKIKGSPEECGR